ncbi:MAG TPA: ABC transporter [Deltaproteobacteria bacterium]|nr:ABC transporter [Deltaproteobacteria bacterium]
MEILQFLQYAFIQRALVAGCFIALLCATLGVLLVLRRLSLIGDGLAHVTFGTAALGLFLKVQPIFVSVPLVVLSSLAILKLTEKARIHGDAAIGMVSALGISVGVLLASLATGFNVDLFSYLFGNILAVTPTEVAISIALAVAVIMVIIGLHRPLLSISFDEEFAKASGINTKAINNIVAVLASVTVVLAMRLVGIMLTSALLILPAVSAIQVARSFKNTMFVAACVALLSVLLGVFLSFTFNLPTGALIVLLNLGLFGILFIVGKQIHRTH